MLPHRIERVSETVREILAEIIQDSVKDPGFPKVFTITHLEVSRDLRHARVHFSQLPDDPDSLAGTQAALSRAKGYLRRELGHRMSLKYLPEFSFHFDPSPAHAQRINELLHGLHLSQTPPAPPDSGSEEVKSS